MKKFIGKSTNKRVTPNTKRVADVLIDWYSPFPVSDYRTLD
jgi:hypothetical protein